MDEDNVDGVMIENATRCEDQFSTCNIDVTSFDDVYTVSCAKPSQLNSTQKEEICKLLEVNMRSHYEKTWGWDLNEKRKELFSPDSRFVIVCDNTSPTKSIIAYVMFQFTWDDENEPEYPVVYVFELQISSAHQRRNIGRKLMNICHTIAKYWSMNKLMLTVFKCNEDAVKFYTSIGYRIDSNSPSACGYSKENYEIMSFKL